MICNVEQVIGDSAIDSLIKTIEFMGFKLWIDNNSLLYLWMDDHKVYLCDCVDIDC